MTPDDARSDLAYVRAIAEEGRAAPLLGGRFAVWWGALAAIALIAHWAVLAGLSPLAVHQIGLIWAVFGVVGGVGSFALSRTLRSKPGLSSAGNQASDATWVTTSVCLFAFAIATTVRFSFFEADVSLAAAARTFDVIIPVAFVCYTIAFAVSARLTRSAWLWTLAGVSLAAVFVSALLVGRAEIYLFAAGVVVVVAVVPGALQIGREPGDVV